MTFIVRLHVDEAGFLVGFVERVKTGEKERFHGVAAISRVIAGMMNIALDNRSGEERQ